MRVKGEKMKGAESELGKGIGLIETGWWEGSQS